MKRRAALARPAIARARLVASRIAGVALGAAFGLVTVLRHTKPLHSIGAVTRASWVITEPAGLGVPLLDRPGQRSVRVRLSRAASLSDHGPDIMGLAIRVPGGTREGGDADLLFATTGVGRWTRFLLLPRTEWGVGDYTTLLPLAWRRGTAVLRLHARSVTHYDLSVGVNERRRAGRMSWRPVGRLILDQVPTVDEPLRFRPATSPPAGLSAPAWVRAVRQPAYVAARRLAH